MKNSDFLKGNSFTIQNELDWLSARIDARLNYFFSTEESKVLSETPCPDLDSDQSNMSNFIKNELSDDFERLLIIGAIATIYYPELYDRFLIKNKVLDKPFTEFGGIKTPVEPATGSIITAAIFSEPFSIIKSSSSFVNSSPQLGWPFEKAFFCKL